MTTIERLPGRPGARPAQRSTLTAQDWRARAACRTADPRLFDPPRSQLGYVDAEELQRIQSAQAICRGCPVLAECAAAITTGDEGIRAGRLIPTKH